MTPKINLQGKGSQINLQPNHDGLRVYLRTKQGEKLLGTIVRDTLRVFRDERRHYHRALAGYGINSEVLRDNTRYLFSWVELTIQHNNGVKERHRISRERWLADGIRWMHYQNHCESQVVLPLLVIRAAESGTVPATREIQQSLFPEVAP